MFLVITLHTDVVNKLIYYDSHILQLYYICCKASGLVIALK